MSEWITDRRPTKADADDERRVWTMWNDRPVRLRYYHVVIGQPWMPIVPPEPYVKPKRWTVRYNPYQQCWSLHDRSESQLILFGLDRDDDDHRQAAERIADIYEKVMP